LVAEITPADFLVRALIATVGGMLIGLERERAQSSVKSRDKGSVPGLRSFGLLSLYGALSSYLGLLGSTQGISYIIPLSLTAVMLLVILYAYARMIKQRVLGITTYIVMFATFTVGFLAGLGLVLESAAASVLITLVLAIKVPAERVAASIKYEELLAILEVLALALVVGPIIQSYSESTGLSVAFKIYLFFVIVLTISLTSYMTARVWGAKGIFYSAILGALVNSEATISSLVSMTVRVSDKEYMNRLLRTITPMVIGTAQVKLSLLSIAGVWLFSNYVSSQLIAYTLVIASYSTLVIYLTFMKAGGGGEEIGITVQSPLSWKTAAKGAIAYALLTGIFITLPKLGIGAWVGAPLLISFLGGLVNATAVILSLGTSVSTLTSCQLIASIMLSLAAASLNKIIYADTTRLDKAGIRQIWSWSVLFAIAPVVFAAITMYYC
jgi:uncharacterized membrane protein (DUF4010 family)